MPTIGFSTGALFKDALARGIDFSRELNLKAIELSALRFRELDPLVDFVKGHDLTAFQYVSLHAPSDFTAQQEAGVATALLAIAVQHRWYVVLHPDCIYDESLWRPFGQWLCIENMDKRKPAGRTVEELEHVFAQFPAASLCFDIAHARQVDTSMTEAYRILRTFRNRICQLHMSEVASSSRHDRISNAAVESFREVLNYLPTNVPVILESPVTPETARAEIHQASRVFQSAPAATHR
jgi:hypothetical protein